MDVMGGEKKRKSKTVATGMKKGSIGPVVCSTSQHVIDTRNSTDTNSLSSNTVYTATSVADMI